MSETELIRAIRLAHSNVDVRLFRNNTGRLQNAMGEYVHFGLHIGSSDLIGWKTILVSPRDVGRELAVFVSIEVKDEKRGRLTAAQNFWLEAVRSAGGIAGIARSVEDASRILQDL